MKSRGARFVADSQGAWRTTNCNRPRVRLAYLMRSGLRTVIINVGASLVLLSSVSRLIFVLRTTYGKSGSLERTSNDRVPHWTVTPAKSDPSLRAAPSHEIEQRSSASDALLENRLRRSSQEPILRYQPPSRSRGKSQDEKSINASQRVQDSDDSDPSDMWGTGMKVLIFTMDSLSSRVALAAKGGPAGEIKIRESLTQALKEAGVEVDVATSDLEFERRAGMMDVYDAYVLDPWTWAGKGHVLKAQLRGRQDRMFILDFFGADEPHQNLGVPRIQHLTAFPVPAEHERTFLGYGIDSGDIPNWPLDKKRQGVLWGKTAASFSSASARTLVLELADYVELHSTIDPRKAIVRHDNIVYHGTLTREEWHRLLQESKFMIGLGDPLAGPSAVDAVLAGCAYINPVFASPARNIYRSQQPFMEDRVGTPYVCSFQQKDVEGALHCVQRALEQDLDPLLPSELTKRAHRKRVREIFKQAYVQ